MRLRRGITTQLTFLVGSFALLTLGVTGGLSYLVQLSRSDSQMAVDAASKKQAILELLNDASREQAVVQRLLRERDPDMMERLIDQRGKLGKAVADRLAKMKGAEALIRAENGLKSANDKAVDLLLRGEHAPAQQAFLEEANPAQEKLMTSLADFADQSDKAVRAELDRSATRRAVWQTVIYALVFAGIGGLCVVSLTLLRRATSRLRRAASDLASAAAEVASASHQISTSSQSLATSSSDQAASLDRTASSSAQVTAMTSDNSKHAHSAAKRMATAVSAVKEANSRLNDLTESMKRINTSGQQIGRIMRVVDDISFQTNILALNAAVEAARAGEAGLGFAVVADEVRSLAQRCAQAARETAALVEDSLQSAADGDRKVGEVNEAVSRITQVSTEASALVGQLSEGSDNQARSMGEIAQTISMLRQLTQDTASQSEETSSSAQELAAQSNTLRDIASGLTEVVG